MRRVIRGGSWNNNTDWVRSSARNRNNTDNRNNNVGFRVVRVSRQSAQGQAALSPESVCPRSARACVRVSMTLFPGSAGMLKPNR